MRMVSRRGPFCDFLLALLLSSSSFSPSACPSTTTGPSALLILLQSSIVVALLLLQFLLGKKGKGIGGTPHVQYILRREEESGSITRSVDATLVATAGITRMKLTKVHWWGCLALLWLDLLTTHKRREELDSSNKIVLLTSSTLEYLLEFISKEVDLLCYSICIFKDVL